jgi:hypothetical protein
MISELGVKVMENDFKNLRAWCESDEEHSEKLLVLES